MLTSRILLSGIAALVSCLGVAILRKQSRAESCPVHSRRVGAVATFLAYMLFLVSVGLLSYAWYFLPVIWQDGIG